MGPTERLTEAEIAARLRLSATRLARRMRQEAATGLSPSQLSALAVVHARGPLTLGELAELEQVAPPTISKVVAKLEADGLLDRQVDPTDKRVSLVQATKAGAHLHDESKRRRTTWLAGRIRELSPEEQARLAGALDVLDRLHGDRP
ncbi:MAG TPA: MarR family transcriptional regulator [Acidimicrobiales bacterium]|nr:MarR family transcriptional regulator [Acidimicrobiales bacterium]